MINIKKYIKKPTEVQAMQFTGSDVNMEELSEFTNGMFIRSHTVEGGKEWDYTLRTLEGNQYPTVGDWVIKGSSSQNGEHFWLNKPDYFEENYEEC